MAYYNFKKKPIGNLLADGFKINRKLEICKLQKCYAICDLDWTNKWLVDAEERVIKKFPANVLNNKSICFNPEFLKRQSFSHWVKSDMAHIVWMPTLLCNYDCIYCGCAMGADFVRRSFQSSYPELNIEDWIHIFEKKILSEFEVIVFDISGGEPFLSKSILPVLNTISERSFITITTNASVDIIKIIDKNKFRPQDKRINSGISFHLSWHPLAKDVGFNSFLDKAIYLKERGFLEAVNFVAHSKQLHLIDYYKNIFEKNRIPFVILYWCGQDNEGREGYSDMEIEYIKERMNNSTPIKVPEPIIVNDLNVESNNNTIQILKSPDIYFRGIPFDFKLKINISYLSTILQGVDKNNLFLGCVIFCVGSNGKLKVSEQRKKITEDMQNPNFITDFLIDSKDLLVGSYELKFDVVNENSFWFEDLGFKPTVINAEVLSAPYKAELKIEDYSDLPLKINSDYVFKIKVNNVGILRWAKDERCNDDFKLGCRLIDKEGIVRSEYRVEFPSPVEPEDEFRGIMSVHILTLAEGRYEFRFDVVNENKFWFEDLGSFPYSLPVEITKSPA
jgi:organic radical activating enzyme